MPRVQCCELKLGWVSAPLSLPFAGCCQQCTTCAPVPDILITFRLTQHEGRRPILCLCLENENKGSMSFLQGEDSERSGLGTAPETYPDNTPSTRFSIKKEPMMMRGMKYNQFQVFPEASLLCGRRGGKAGECSVGFR